MSRPGGLVCQMCSTTVASMSGTTVLTLTVVLPIGSLARPGVRSKVACAWWADVARCTRPSEAGVVG